MSKMKKVIATIMISVIAITNLVGCTAKAYSNRLECCGTITRYPKMKLAVTGCKYFKCTTATGRWTRIDGGFYFWTTDGRYHATGQLDGDVMTIIF